MLTGVADKLLSKLSSLRALMFSMFRLKAVVALLASWLTSEFRLGLQNDLSLTWPLLLTTMSGSRDECHHENLTPQDRAQSLAKRVEEDPSLPSLNRTNLDLRLLSLPYHSCVDSNAFVVLLRSLNRRRLKILMNQTTRLNTIRTMASLAYRSLITLIMSFNSLSLLLLLEIHLAELEELAIVS